MSIRIEIWGNNACFSRPELKVERASYDVITPSAARGILEAVYWHPGVRYVIDRIYVLSEISFTNIRRNEVASKALGSALLRIMQTGSGEAGIVTSKEIQQRAAMVLQNVHYVIEAHFDLTDKCNPSDNAGKFQDIIKRRLKRGQCYHTPYMGCREFPANFKLWEGGDDIKTIDDTRDMGFMLYDMDYSNPQDIQPMYFRARMEHGVIDLRNCEVFR